MTKPTQQDDMPSSESDVIILDDKGRSAYTARTSRNTANLMPTVLEEPEMMGLAEAPVANYLDALTKDGGVSSYLTFLSSEDLTFSRDADMPITLPMPITLSMPITLPMPIATCLSLR